MGKILITPCLLSFWTQKSRVLIKVSPTKGTDSEVLHYRKIALVHYSVQDEVSGKKNKNKKHKHDTKESRRIVSPDSTWLHRFFIAIAASKTMACALLQWRKVIDSNNDSMSYWTGDENET